MLGRRMKLWDRIFVWGCNITMVACPIGFVVLVILDRAGWLR